MSLTKLDIPKGWEKVVVPKDWRAFYNKHGLYNRLKKATMNKTIIVILCSLFALNVFSQVNIAPGAGITFSSLDTTDWITIESDSVDFSGWVGFLDWVDCTPSRGNLLTLGFIDLTVDDFSIPIGDGLAMIGDKVTIDTAYLLSQGWKLPEPKVVKINQSGSGLWGVNMLAPFLIFNQLDTIPTLDSTVFYKENRKWYKIEYYSDRKIEYTEPVDSTMLAKEIELLVLDSLSYEFEIEDNQLLKTKLNKRIDRKNEEIPAIRQKLKDVKVSLKELRRLFNRITN